MLLCIINGAWAQDFTVATTTTDYNAIQVGHYYAFRECANNVGFLNGASDKTSTVSANQIYKIVDAGEGKVWLQCYGTSEYLGLGNSKSNGNQYETAMVAESANAVAFTFSQRGNAAQVVLDCYPNGGSTKFWLGAQGGGASYAAHYQNNGTGNLSYWSAFEVTFTENPQAKVITTYESAVNYLMTVDPNFLALAGTGAHFGLNVVNSAGQNHQWLNLVDATKAQGNVLTTDRLFQLANSTTNGCYWIQNYAGNYMTAAGVFGSNTAGVNLTVTNTAAGSDTNGYNNQTNKQIRFNKTGSSDNFRLRSGEAYDFANATGSWTGFVAFGPFYVVTIQHKCGEQILESSTAIYSGGELTVNANYYDGYVADESSVTEMINADKTIVLNYQAEAIPDAELITTEAAARANHLLTYEQFMAKINAAQPSGRYAFRWLTTNGTQQWRNLKDNTRSENLTKEFLNSFTKHNSYWWITNYAGQHLNGRDGNGGTFGETGVDFNITNDAVSESNFPAYFTTAHEIRFKRASDNNYYGYPGSATPNFSTANGGYMGFAAYGPFYVITVKAECDGQEISRQEVISSYGNLTLNAPEVAGYEATEANKNLLVNEDMEVTFQYSVALPAGDPTTVNLTPWPKAMNVYEGTYTLPDSYTLDLDGITDGALQTVIGSGEAYNFTTTLSTASGKTGRLTYTGTGDITLVQNNELGDEAYNLNITAEGIRIEAKTQTGFYYALQTIKKMLPGHVMAGVSGEGDYALPLVSIQDEPRFGYRGFMLDVSRHFFDADEICRILDVMAAYKMNKFHWHLTDDHGWRVPIDGYDRLISVGSSRSRWWEISWENKEGSWHEEEYRYSYTKDDIARVVAHAAALHIDIIPEVDMPGHFAAAMASYPEYSCNPSGSHSVVAYNVGGISGDVLNVANPQAVQFAKDILTQVMILFPNSQYIHIGGDECPATAWQNNAECQALYASKGYSSYRELQSDFTLEMAKHVQAQGRKLMAWNETITAGGSNTSKIQEADATIMCWTGAAGAAQTAANTLGLDFVYTPQYHWYINQVQSSDYGEPAGAGNGQNSLPNVYNEADIAGNITDLSHYLGVQGTFWCEHVSGNMLLEYLMLPRLQAIAEYGWTPQNRKDFDDFVRRFNADTDYLEAAGYNYAPHYTYGYEAPQPPSPTVSEDNNKTWFRITSFASDDRKDRVIELAQSTSNNVSNNVTVDRLWENTVVADNLYQQWALEESTENPGHFALVCRALPNGSVNPVLASGSGSSGRWSYVADKKHFNFILDGKGKDNDVFYYSIKSEKITGDYCYMNASKSGQNYAINTWNDASDDRAGYWKFIEVETEAPAADQSYAVTFHKYQASETKAYATVFLSFPAEIPAGMKAYSAVPSEEDPEMLNLTRIEGNVLPAHTPAILTSTSAVTGEAVSAPVTLHESHATAAPVMGNQLLGTTTKNMVVQDGYTYYVLGKKTGIAFYPYTSQVLPDHRAWYRHESSQAGTAAFRFNFGGDDILTYIEAIESDHSKAEIFDLQGHRLRQAQPGINLINGKKIYVK